MSTDLVRQLSREDATWDNLLSEVRPMVRGNGNGDSGLTWEIIEDLKEQGFNQNDIAREFGVSRQYVSAVKRQNPDYSKTPRERAMEAFPWKVSFEHQGQTPYDMLRAHLDYMVTRADGWSDEKKIRLVRFYERLTRDDVVVEYDPSHPPSEGISRGGFAYLPRENKDGDLMIRVNRLAQVKDNDRPLWRVPKVWPRVK